jgi:hypothetical protein
MMTGKGFESMQYEKPRLGDVRRERFSHYLVFRPFLLTLKVFVELKVTLLKTHLKY